MILSIGINASIRYFKLGNIEHMLHNNKINILCYNKEYEIIDTINTNDYALLLTCPYINSVYIIDRSLNTYYLKILNLSITYKYVCIYVKDGYIESYNIDDTFAKCEQILTRNHKIFMIKSDDKFIQYIHKHLDITADLIDKYDNDNDHIYDYCIILKQNHTIIHNFNKEILKLIAINSPSIFLSNSKDTYFINNNINNEIIHIKPLTISYQCIHNINKLFINVYKLLPQVTVILKDISFKHTVLNQDYNNIIIKDKLDECDINYIIITNQYLPYNFISSLMIQPDNVNYAISIIRHDQNNIVSKLRLLENINIREHESCDILIFIKNRAYSLIHTDVTVSYR